MNDSHFTEPKNTVIVPVLTVAAAEAAALIGIGRTLFLKMHGSGRLPLPIRLGRAVRWRKQELIDWLNAGCPGRERWKWKVDL